MRRVSEGKEEARRTRTHTNDGGLGDSRVLNESGLDLGGRESMSRDVDDIVDSSSDPVCEGKRNQRFASMSQLGAKRTVAVEITTSSVTGEVVSRVGLETKSDELRRE